MAEQLLLINMIEITSNRFFRETFIIRFWRDNSAAASWNGQIQHIRSGQITILQNIDDIPARLRSLLDEQPTEYRGGLR